jgi:hypothetical protein
MDDEIGLIILDLIEYAEAEKYGEDYDETKERKRPESDISIGAKK